MSVSYASGLSYYANKGVCGLPEYTDTSSVLETKLNELYQLMRRSQFTVVHTGAGISTSSGIPDFRGPNGVWTMEQLGKAPCQSIAFEHAVPSPTHRTLVDLERYGVLQYLITQNIDGLHLRSGFPRDRLSILHGDMFLERCSMCGTLYARSTPTVTMGLKRTGVSCTYIKESSHRCRGKLHDTVLDWENDLPELDYNLAMDKSKCAELHVCIGTSLQMYPAASLPLLSSRPKNAPRKATKSDKEFPSSLSKIVIINLQKTKLAKRAWLNIHAKADFVLSNLASRFFGTPSVDLGATSQCFTPTLVLRSQHSTPSDVSPWRVLPHPTAGENIRIVEYWSEKNQYDFKNSRCPVPNTNKNAPDEVHPRIKREKT